MITTCQYTELLIENGVQTIEGLLRLSEEEVTSLGVRLLHARDMLRKASLLKGDVV